MSATQNAAGISTANDRGIEVRDLITHLQALDPYARVVFTADGYTETPACVKDFTRQASGTVEIKVPEDLVKELEGGKDDYKDELKELEDENERLESELGDTRAKLSTFESALASIRRSVSEALED